MDVLSRCRSKRDRLRNSLRGKHLSKFAWQLLTGFTLFTLIFTVISYRTVWFNIEFVNDCEHEIFIAVYVRSGICYTDNAIGYTKHGCVLWTETETWKALDDVSGTRTEHAAAEVFPAANSIVTTLIATACLELILCVYSLRRPDSPFGRLRQYFVAGLALFYIIASYTAGSLSSTTDITVESTWKPLITCTEAYSYPFTAQWALILGLLLSVVVVIIAICPSKMWCFQFISAEEESLVEQKGGQSEVYDGSSAHSPSCDFERRGISMIEMSQPSSASIQHVEGFSVNMSVAAPIEYKSDFGDSADEEELTNKQNKGC